ncbi:MAG: hypothetical protein Q9217_004812 [Psora testacea]
MHKLSIALAAVFVAATQASLMPRHEYHQPNGTHSLPSFPHPGPSSHPHLGPTDTTSNPPIIPSAASSTGSPGTASSNSASRGFSPSSIGKGSGSLSSSFSPLSTGIGLGSLSSSFSPSSTGIGSGSPASNVPSNGPVAPYPTGGSAPAAIGTGTNPAGPGASSPSNGGGNPESPSTTGDLTLTYTLGSGASTTIVTTTIKNTRTATNYKTIYLNPTEAGQAGAGETSSPENSPEQNDSNPITNTVKRYRTSTRFVYAPSDAPGSPGSSGSPANGCPPQVTVTVPGPDVTVTVTAMAAPPSGVPGGPASPESSGPASPPFPTTSSNNGISPISGTVSKKKCKSTGFVTKPSASATFKLPPADSDMFPVPSAYAKRR